MVKRISSGTAIGLKRETYDVSRTTDYEDGLIAHSGIWQLRCAVGTNGRFFVGVAFVGRKREELLALPAGSDFEIRHPLLVDLGRQQQFERVVP